jgi:hypothetical protein
VVRPGEDERTAEAARIKDILETPVRELADGSKRFYTTDERLTFGGGANTRGGVSAVRPRTDGSKRTVWTRTETAYVLSDGDQEFAHAEASGPISKDDLPAYFSYDRETGQYTVYAQGEKHVYESKSALEAEWTPVKRPFIPAQDFPEPEYEREDYHVLLLPSTGPPLLVEDGETTPLAADLTVLDPPTEPDSTTDPDPPAEPEQDDTGETSQTAMEVDSDLELNPEDDDVGVFVDRCIVRDPEAQIPKDNLYQVYSNWATSHGLEPTNKSWFSRKLYKHIPERSSRPRGEGDRSYHYQGIALSEAAERQFEPRELSE